AAGKAAVPGRVGIHGSGAQVTQRVPEPASALIDSAGSGTLWVTCAPSALDLEGGALDQRLDLFARGAELVAGDAVLQRGHGHPVVQANLQVVLKVAPEEACAEGVARSYTVDHVHLERARLEVARAVVNDRAVRSESQRDGARV